MKAVSWLQSYPIHGLSPYIHTLSDTISDVNDLAFKGLFFASIPMLRPAYIIHLWLPLFALSSLAVKLFFPVLRAVEKAQWFLKQGEAHPFKAIGVVATITVFGSAMLVKEAWTVL
jgi:hypothetical protein